jgi:hypothetical protein
MFVCGRGKGSRRNSYSPSKLCQNSGQWWNVQSILQAPPPPPKKKEWCGVRRTKLQSDRAASALPIHLRGNFRFKRSRLTRSLKMRRCSVLKNSQPVIWTLSPQNRHKEFPQLVNVHETNHSAWVTVRLPTLSFVWNNFQRKLKKKTKNNNYRPTIYAVRQLQYNLVWY